MDSGHRKEKEISAHMEFICNGTKMVKKKSWGQVIIFPLGRKIKGRVRSEGKTG